MMDGGMMGGLWVLWVLFSLALIALAVTGAVWLVRNMSGSNRNDDGHQSQPTARDGLDRRYAAGELSRDEYLDRRRDREG